MSYESKENVKDELRPEWLKKTVSCRLCQQVDGSCLRANTSFFLLLMSNPFDGDFCTAAIELREIAFPKCAVLERFCLFPATENVLRLFPGWCIKTRREGF